MSESPLSSPSATNNSEDNIENSVFSFLTSDTSPDSPERSNMINLSDNVDLTTDRPDDTQEFNLQDSFDESNIDSELERINNFVANIENNLAELGVQLNGAAAPIVVRQANLLHQPVDTIDLSNFELEPQPRSARVRSTSSIIDLCTPPRRLPAFIDLDAHELSSDRPARQRRNLNDNISPPKRQRNEDESFTGDAYKCPVCFECVHYKEPSTTKCGHVFCKTCIETAVKNNRKCPLCNKKLSLKQITRIYL